MVLYFGSKIAELVGMHTDKPVGTLSNILWTLWLFKVLNQTSDKRKICSINLFITILIRMSLATIIGGLHAKRKTCNLRVFNYNRVLIQPH